MGVLTVAAADRILPPGQPRVRVLAALIARQRHDGYVPQARKNVTDAQALGELVAAYFDWDAAQVLRVAQSGLYDSNCHGLSFTVKEMADVLDPPFDPDALIDDDTRKALFAALREHYGRELDRDDRLRKVNVLLGLAEANRVYSFSRRGNMTMGHARRVLDILNEL